MMKRPANKNPFTASEVGVLLEEIRSNVSAVAEGQVALNDSMEDVKGRLTTLEKKVDVLDVKVEVLKTDVGALKLAVTQIMADTKEIKNTLTGHDKRLLKIEEICLK